MPQPGMERWRGKVALVTGASSGIGQAVTRRLVHEGLQVVAAARRKSRVVELAQALGQQTGRPDAVQPVRMDVTDEARVQEVLGGVRERQGGLHVLVNNAGLGYEESLLDGDTERWREMLEVNVLGLCVVTREGVAAMRATGEEGHVLHLGSLAGHRTAAGANLYGATKYAVRALTESLRNELHAAGLPIRVSCVSPGYVQTEFHTRYFGSQQRADALYEGLRPLDPEDVADALAYALGTPSHVQVHDVLVRSAAQTT